MYDIAYLIQCILLDNRKALSLQPYSRKAKDLRLLHKRGMGLGGSRAPRATCRTHIPTVSSYGRGSCVETLFNTPHPFWPRRGRCDQQCNSSASEFAALEVSGAAASSSAVPMKRGRKEDPGDEVQAGQEKGARIPKTSSTSNPTLLGPKPLDPLFFGFR